MASDGHAVGLTSAEAIDQEIAQRRTARLTLRPVAMGDLKAAYAIYSRPEVVRHRPDPVPDSKALCARRLEKEVRHWEKHDIGRWAILKDGAVIGFGGLTHKVGFFGLNLSYHLNPDHWGQGYAQEFVSEALAVAFGPRQAQRVIGLVRPVNTASLRVLEKAGFAKEAEVMLEGSTSLLYARHAKG